MSVEWITQNKERGAIFADTEKWRVSVIKMEARLSWKLGAAMPFEYSTQYRLILFLYFVVFNLGDIYRARVKMRAWKLCLDFMKGVQFEKKHLGRLSNIYQCIKLLTWEKSCCDILIQKNEWFSKATNLCFLRTTAGPVGIPPRK